MVFISNRKSRVIQEVYVHSTRYVFNELESFGVRNCAEYDFTVFSKNLYSLSLNGVSGRRIIPTGIYIILFLSLSQIYLNSDHWSCMYVRTIVDENL